MAVAEGALNTKRHPMIGEKPANVITNADVLALPERERQAWVHGAVTLTAQTVASIDAGNARCISDWYFQYDEASNLIVETMRAYSDASASATIHALATRACEGR